MSVRRVVCAANKYELNDGSTKIFTGIRHYCPVMCQNIEFWKLSIKRSTEVQGFVDQKGVFMYRLEALQVAKDAGHLNIARPKTSPEDRLFSEDLY